MTTYRTLNIENFKGIREMEITEQQPFGMVNVFVGGNNVGKTSVLHALCFATILNSYQNPKTAFEKFMDELNFKPRYFHIKHASVLFEQVSKLFYNGIENHDLKINDFKAQYVHEEIPDIILNNKIWIDEYENSATVENSLRQFDFLNLLVSKKDEFSLIPFLKEESDLDFSPWHTNNKGLLSNPKLKYISTKTNLLDLIHDNMKAVVRSGGEKKIVELLQGIEPNLADIRSFYKELYFEFKESTYRRDENQMGDGFIKLLAISCVLVNDPYKTIFIDEIENGFHYSVQKNMWRMVLTAAKDHGTQFFFTTHSYEILESLNAMTKEITAEWSYKCWADYDKYNPETGQLLIGDDKQPMDVSCVFKLVKNDEDVVTPFRYTGKKLDEYVKLRGEIR
jgi:AAA15 family ATPase/GTPase